jgi:dienelactone hydrolase
MIHLHETTQLDDQLAALAFLKTHPGIDSTKIIVGGVSFGGIQSLLIATRPAGFIDATNIWGPDVFPKMNKWPNNEKPSR